MSFDVHFFARDYVVESPWRQKTDAEVRAIFDAVVHAGGQFDEPQEEYHFEARDGASVELHANAKDPSAVLALRGMMPSHCVLMFEICKNANWALVLPTLELIAVTPFTAPEDSVFVALGVTQRAARVAETPEALWAELRGSFDGWRDWVDQAFDEVGRRKENRDQ